MCTPACETLLNTYMSLVLEKIETAPKPFLHETNKCLFACLQQTWCKMAAIGFRHYAPGMIHFLAETAFSEAVLKFNQKAEAGQLTDRGAKLKTLFYRFFQFSLLNEIKKEKKNLDNLRPLPENTGELQGSSGGKKDEEMHTILQKALLKLAPDDRQIIVWRHIQLKTIDEIAGFLAIQKDSASNRVYRCMQRLTSEINKITGK